MIENIMLGIAIILLTGLIFGKISKKLHIPNVTGYLIGGLVIGPALFHLIIPAFAGVLSIHLVEAMKFVASIELGFIAFTVGSEFKLSYFKQVGMMPVIIAFSESFFAVVFITIGLTIFGFPLYFALAMGAVGGATAPAATIMVIKQYKAKGMLAQTTKSVVAIDDASALIFFGVAMAISKALINPAQSQLLVTILVPIVEIILSAAIGIASGFLLTYLLKFFKSGANRLILVVAFVFLAIGVCEVFSLIDFWGVHVNMSSLLVCMTMGAIFTNTSKIVEEVMPLVDNVTPPLVVLFFVLAGADLKLENMSLIAVGGLAIYIAFRISGKLFGTWIAAKATKAPDVVKKYLGWGLLPEGGIGIGLAMVVVAEIPVVAGNPFNGELVKVILICSVFLSEVFGPLLLKHALIKSGEGVPDYVKKNKKGEAQPAVETVSTTESATTEEVNEVEED